MQQRTVTAVWQQVIDNLLDLREYLVDQQDFFVFSLRDLVVV